MRHQWRVTPVACDTSRVRHQSRASTETAIAPGPKMMIPQGPKIMIPRGPKMMINKATKYMITKDNNTIFNSFTNYRHV